MSDDLLRRASDALRASHEGSYDRAQETRSRLIASVRRGQPRRRGASIAMLPLAAALAATAAWAGATGRMSAVWQAVENLAVPAPTGQRAAPALSAVPVARARATATAPAPAASETLARPSESPSEAVPAGAPGGRATSPTERGDAGDAEQSAYLTAHRAHFGGGDPAAALRAWDSYLREFPKGRFAPEARYNRALCLVKLGRNAEASRALEPFANGAYGGYRRAEAQSLREALGTP